MSWLPINASVATSFGLQSSASAQGTAQLDNHGSGIVFGNQTLGASDQTSIPTLTQTPTLYNPASAATGVGAPAVAGGGSIGSGASDLLSNPIVLIALLGVAGIVIWKAVKKPG